MTRLTSTVLCAVAISFGFYPVDQVRADPCGMVPPVYVGDDVPIARVGDQNTYVFFKDGVETFVIHPGFQGKVDEFGMLIPFPAIPDLRKVPDTIFPHVRAAIDPPEVVVYAGRFPVMEMARNAGKPQPAAAGRGMMLKDEVRVVKEEAVGMYEVAVLEAGSAKALQRWMDDHGYKYPAGMDAACEDYVAEGWCFVAVKTKVGQKKGVDPKPGMRKAASKMPAGSTFDGHVQAMGFRFRVKELVVPMRLSTFNEGDLHNIVYVLSEEPLKIRSVPEEYVVRQIAGETLLNNVTKPLPLRIIGGTAKDLQPHQKKNLPAQRNPVPKNGAARDLFATDLKAVKDGQLSHPHEEEEKMLLRIGERLSLRGPEIDKLNEGSLAEQREAIVKDSLDGIKGMTLSVIDGNFPREVLQSRNLVFSEYVMPARRNSSEFYDAKTKKPAPPKKQGTLETGAVSTLEAPRTRVVGLALAMGAILCLGGVFAVKRRGSGRLWMLLLTASAVTLGSLAVPAIASAEDEPAKDYSKLENLDLIDLMGDPKQADKAADAVIKRGKKIVPDLLGEAYEGSDLALRGWAIVCLAEIGDPSADGRLKELQNDEKQPMLVRTWAAAGRVKIAQSTDELLALAKGIPNFPAIGRPIGMRLVEKLKSKGDKASAEDILNVTITVPQLQKSLAPAVLAQGADSLVTAMATAKNQNVRRQAAAYLGTLAQKGDKDVAEKVIGRYAFEPKAKDVPWTGGPLFVPGIQWDKKHAHGLVGNLVAWHLWAERHKGKNAAPMTALQTQIHNNLRSIQLARAAGYQSPRFQNASTDQWLGIWGGVVGKAGITKLLEEQGVEKETRYKKIADGLK